MSALPLSSSFYISLAAFLGLVAGWSFHWAWRALLPRGYNREILARVPHHLRSMLASDEAAVLFHHYCALLKTIARYAGRNLLAVAAGVVPVTAIFLLLATTSPPSHTAALQRNPWRSHFNDAELVFFLAVTVGSVAAAWKKRVPGEAGV